MKILGKSGYICSYVQFLFPGEQMPGTFVYQDTKLQHVTLTHHETTICHFYMLVCVQIKQTINTLATSSNFLSLF